MCGDITGLPFPYIMTYNLKSQFILCNKQNFQCFSYAGSFYDYNYIDNCMYFHKK